MNLNEFAIDFLENALISVDQDGYSQEDSVTRDILEYIKDSGDILEPELCHYKIKGIKINAYDYDDDNDTIDLFVTIYKAEPKKVSDSDVSDAFDKVLKFFNEARDGQLFGKVDESNESVFELIQIIQQTKSSVNNVRIFVLTNGMCSPNIVPHDREESGVYLDFELWDIERVYQQYLIRAGKQKIEIDFLADYNYKLRCLQMEAVSETVDEYLAILPAKILASIYNKYKQGLLEKNVRTFLQFKAKVNQGIRDTIRNEPDMFFAYNNGISTTAERVEVFVENNIPCICKIEGWQIVNGGQTTASIFATSMEKGTDLSKVFVQMKVSVVKNSNEVEEIVPKISKFANSQTAIKDSDFSSNSQYHVAVENFSRKTWMPANTGGKATNKWFYERTRGQYLDERSRASGQELRRFDGEYPKKFKFTKTDLAKYEMSWWQRPYDVSKGAEKNYKIFEKEMDTSKSEVSERYYTRLIAKAILFKEIDKIVIKRSLGGYKANVVSYIFSWLSYKTEKKLNLDQIWNEQSISESLHSLIDQMVTPVWEHINNPPKHKKNIGEWCKAQECWSNLKDKYLDLSLVTDEVKSFSNDYVENDILGQELNPQEIKMIEEASAVKAETWFSLAKWAKEKNVFTPFDRKLTYNLGVIASRSKTLSPKQAKNALRILKESKDMGFTTAAEALT